jgi:hypothetical protein
MRTPIDDEEALFSEVVLRLTQILSANKSALVSIDGLAGAGKTTLAAKLARHIDGTVVSLDQYLVPQQGSYLPYLRYDELQRDLEAARSNGSAVVVIEGLYVRAVIARLGAVADISIYVRLVDEYGSWVDEFYFSEDNDLQEMLDTFARFERLPGIGDKDREAARYHIEEKPISNADFVYDRTRHPPPE